ncbi:phage baseplate assembly protein V [Streptomyces sp. NPDC004609]|uniref:phage baseplate assembly protein V n=1 Tax=Streptomyces sp. NPDC004609 TaxID=3364704 RepID=UPI00369E6118
MPDQYFGKYTGIVKDNRDDTNLGQVKVSVPAVFPPDELMSARPALPYGYHFVPENGAKVWVEFEGGDPGLALWSGIQYVSGEWPAEARANPPHFRVMRSATGHVLLLDDKGGQEKIRISDGVHQHTVTLDADGITLKEGKAGHRITITSQGIRAELASGAAIDMTSAGTKVDGGAGTVEVKGSVIKLSAATVEAGTTVRLGAGTSPVIRVGDSGIGNLGAPVIMTVTTNTQVTA